MFDLDDVLGLARYFPSNRLFGETGLLTTNQLYLPRLSAQHDPLEGLATDATVQSIFEGEREQDNPEWVAPLLLKFQGIMAKHATFVSCWTKDLTAKQNSAQVYGNAVAMIVTNVSSLKAIIPQTAKVGEVTYVGELQDQNGINMDTINFSKRANFAWEDEVRIIDYMAHQGEILQNTLDNAPNHLVYDFTPREFIAKIVILPTTEQSDRERLLEYAINHSIEFEVLDTWPT